MQEEQSVRLRFTQGSSDKEYNAHLKRQGDGWVLHCSNGRWDGAQKAQIKIAEPVPYEVAKKEYDKVVKQKTSKGYTPNGSGIAFSGTDDADRVTGWVPQLLNEITREEMRAIIAAEPGQWFLQEKMDGERRAALVSAEGAVAANKKGLSVPMRAEFASAIARMQDHGLKTMDLDGEDMGHYLAVFDPLMLDGQDLRNTPFERRAHELEAVKNLARIAEVENVIRIVPAVRMESVQDFDHWVDAFEARKAEGVVFKRADSIVEPGQPASSGTQRKLKFRVDVTARVKAQTLGKRSVMLELLDEEGAWVEVGKVTIPANQDIPAPGTLVDVTYLYAYKGGSLFQPVYQKTRTDYDEAECLLRKLKYKAENIAA